MIDLENLPQDLKNILRDKFGEKLDDIQIPPTAFTTMKGIMLEYNINDKYVVNKFPVLDSQLNQFGNMQGGMIAAAIDNTLGPLSMLVGPPNFTRQLEIKYKKIINPSIGEIYVEAKLLDENKRQLFFSAKVYDSDNQVFAIAKAIHWIL